MELPGIPARILEERILLLEKEIWEQQIYNNWLLWLLDGKERTNPPSPEKEARKEKSLDEILGEPTILEEEELSLEDILNQPLVKVEEYDPFETIANLQELLKDFISENNLLSLIISQRQRPKYFLSFQEYREK